MARRECQAIELGVIGYGAAWALQQRLAAARKAGEAPDMLLLCEHPPVVTLGRNGKLDHLRASADELGRMGVEFYHSDRGGDATYHGPGQIVGYPILDLSGMRRDVGWYVHGLEETMIRASASFGVPAFRVPGKPGVWTASSGERCETTHAEKLGAIGVHLSRWVTTHGFAYNVCTDLRGFELIVPCGIAGCKATSLEKLVQRPIGTDEALPQLIAAFGETFELAMIAAGRTEIERWQAEPKERLAVTQRTGSNE